MNARYEFLGVSALLLVIAGLSVVLLINVRETMRVVGPPKLDGGGEWPDRPESGPEQMEAAVALPPFPVHIDIFDEPWKPEATPTPVVLPTPTPTLPVFGKWDVILIIGDAVQIRDALRVVHYLREGDTFEGCIVEKVDWEKNEILVRNNTDGRVKTLEKTGK